MVPSKSDDRRRSHLRAAVTTVCGLGTLLGAATFVPPSVLGALFLVVAVGTAVVERRYTTRYRGTLSLPTAAMGTTVLLWDIFARSSDPGYALGGLLFIVFGLANAFGLSAVSRSFRELGEATGRVLR